MNFVGRKGIETFSETSRIKAFFETIWIKTFETSGIKTFCETIGLWGSGLADQTAGPVRAEFARKVDTRPSGKGKVNSHGTRPVR